MATRVWVQERDVMTRVLGAGEGCDHSHMIMQLFEHELKNYTIVAILSFAITRINYILLTGSNIKTKVNSRKIPSAYIAISSAVRHVLKTDI